MIVFEQDYHDYLLPLPSGSIASSWHNILNSTPVNPVETDYVNYYNGLSITDKEESAYTIFSSLYDLIDGEEHHLYYDAFENILWSLDGFCKRKKKPAK